MDSCKDFCEQKYSFFMVAYTRLCFSLYTIPGFTIEGAKEIV